MAPPGTAAPKILFFFLLSLLTVCSPVAGMFMKLQEPPMEEAQSFISSRRHLITTAILGFLASNSTPTATAAAAAPQATNPDTVTVSPTPPLNTVPSSTPVAAAPAPPTAATNPPANNSGRPSWCIAKPGAPAKSLQAALDYACGFGAECAAIQQNSTCYNPNTLQNHASYAFSSFYQKHSGQATSCNFKGVAEITNANPSYGLCVYPSSTSRTTAPPTTTPVTPNPATPTTPTNSGLAPAPIIFSGNNTPLGGGSAGFVGDPPTPTPTGSPSSSTISANLQQPFINCIIFVASVITVFDI